MMKTVNKDAYSILLSHILDSDPGGKWRWRNDDEDAGRAAGDASVFLPVLEDEFLENPRRARSMERPTADKETEAFGRKSRIRSPSVSPPRLTKSPRPMRRSPVSTTRKDIDRWELCGKAYFAPQPPPGPMWLVGVPSVPSPAAEITSLLTVAPFPFTVPLYPLTTPSNVPQASLSEPPKPQTIPLELPMMQAREMNAPPILPITSAAAVNMPPENLYKGHVTPRTVKSHNKKKHRSKRVREMVMSLLIEVISELPLEEECAADAPYIISVNSSESSILDTLYATSDKEPTKCVTEDDTNGNKGGNITVITTANARTSAASVNCIQPSSSYIDIGCSIAIQAAHTIDHNSDTGCERECQECGGRTEEWVGGVRALRDSHVRLVVRQLRHIERLNRALDRVGIARALTPQQPLPNVAAPPPSPAPSCPSSARRQRTSTLPFNSRSRRPAT